MYVHLNIFLDLIPSFNLTNWEIRRESGPTECWANNGTTRVNSPLDLPHLRHWHRYTARSQAFAIGHTNRHRYCFI